MGCRRNVRVDMLSLATFCQAIAEVLVNFCDEGQSHADLWIRVKGAINFLSYYPERSPEQRKRDMLDLPKYGFRGGIGGLTYEQLVITKNFLKNHEKKLLRTKKTLPLILDLRLSPEQRRKAAGYCIKLFSDLVIHYLYHFEFPPEIGIPRGLLELLEDKGKKPKKATRRKTASKSGGKK